MTENNVDKSLKIVGSVLFWCFMLTMAILIFMVLQSRLTGEEPSLLGYRLYIVETGSMEPAIRISSLIVVKEVSPNVIKVGDVVTYSFDNISDRVTHRVVRIQGNNEAFITKGDTNNVADMTPVKREMIIGRVSFSIPVLGYVLKFLGSAPGIVFMALSALASAIIPMFFRREPKKA